jgi:hypothetical protein
LSLGKSSPTICAASVIFKNLPKENNRPIGENSLNLVTLFAEEIKFLLNLAS